jgi:hypothetical protein
MPDWQKLVRRQLAGLALEPHEHREVVEELASHLQDTYAAFRGQGLAEDEAAQRALALAGDWNDLRRRIQAARIRKDTMTNRVTQLWLPGLLTFTVSIGLVALGQRLGPRPMFLHLDKGTPILMFYTGWLFTLPLAGAIGAYLSKRAGGSLRMVLASSVFPVLPYAAVFLIAIPVGLVMGANLPDHMVARAIFSMVIGWILVPGAALLAGGLVVQFLLSRRLDSRSLASR